MTSSNGNILRVTGPLCGEFTSPGEIPAQRPVTRSFDVFLICARINDWVNNREAGDLRRHRGHYDVIVMFFNHLAKCRHVAAGTLVQIGSSQVMVCRVLGAKSRTYDGIIVNWTLRIQLQWNLNQNTFHFKKTHSKIPSAKLLQFGLGLNMLTEKLVFLGQSVITPRWFAISR